MFSIGLSQTAQAADFNPHSIITDVELQDYESLGRSEIRSFLANRNSALTEMIIPDYEGKNRYVSDIIYNASHQYQINPKYLLVKLQKEQSLVTATNPTERQLNWATGYAVCDSCDTTDPALAKYKGFGKQVDAAAGIMRYYYENSGTQTWIKTAGKTYTIDNQEITPTSNATAFLYTYTPHVQGNENFAKLWSTWFASSYPEGTLLKASGKSTVYVLVNGKKHPIANISVLNSRYNLKLLVTVPESELLKYPEGSAIAFQNFSIVHIGSTYYLLDYETARPFVNSEIVKKLGYAADEIIEALPQDLEGYKIGEPITLASVAITGRLVKMGTSLYYLKDTGYYSISDPAIAVARFPNVNTEPGKPSDFENLTNLGPLLFPDATLVGSKLTKAVYVIENNKKRLIPSEAVFLGLGYQWKNVLWANDTTLEQHQTGEALYYDTTKQTTSSTLSIGKTTATTSKPLRPQAQIVAAKIFTQDLKPGSTGAEVLALQKLLTKKKYLTATPNGNFGPATTAALKKFQKANKILALGTVGPSTRAVLNKLTSSSSPVASTGTSEVAKPEIPKVIYFTPPTNNSPVDFKEAGKMYAVNTSTIQTIGPVFETEIDAYLVARLHNGVPEIVAGKNIDVPRPLASLSKVFTADLLLRDNLNLDLATTYSATRHYLPYDGNPWPVADGDVLLNKDSMTALIVSSFNRAALVLIEAAGRTQPEFVAMMNADARTRGLQHTYFADPHGLNQYNQSTAREYMDIFLHATQNPVLLNYLSTPNYTFNEVFSADKTTVHSDLNSNRLIRTAGLPYTVTATKTGFLYESGYNIVMTVTRPSDNAEFFILTLGNPNYDKKSSETDRITRWAINTF